MRAFRAFTAIAALLSLSGCDVWVGKRFFTEAESRPPFVKGLYRITGGDGPFIAEWTGQTFIERRKKREGKDDEPLIVPLGSAHPGFFVLQMNMADEEKGAIYAVARGDSRNFVLGWPQCSQTETIVIAAGGVLQPVQTMSVAAPTLEHERQRRGRAKRVKVQVPPVEAPARVTNNCAFSDRESLLSAARRYVTERQIVGPKIERIDR